MWRAVERAPPYNWTITPPLHQKHFSLISHYNYLFKEANVTNHCSFVELPSELYTPQSFLVLVHLKNLHYRPWAQRETTFHRLFHLHALLLLPRHNLSTYILAASAAGVWRRKRIYGTMMKLNPQGSQCTGPRSAEHPWELVIYLQGHDNKHFSTGT